ncbi:hypothetical protein Tco_0269600 [Tanacetum coccineum]
MLNKKLQADYWNEMCYQLLKLMIQKMNIKFRGGLLGLKDFKIILRVTTAQYKVNAAGLQLLEELLLNPQKQSTTDSKLATRVSALEKICANFKKKNKLHDMTTQALSSRVYTLENHDLYSKIEKYVNEVVKEAVHNALQNPTHEHFRDLSEFEMKEILHDRMFESGSYRSHLEHTTLYEALEASMDRKNKEKFNEEMEKSRKRRRDDQDPLPPPKYSDQSKKKRHDSDSLASKQPLLKPVPKEDIPETPEPDWVIPPIDLPETENNWADALAKTYKDPEENKLLRKTRDMRSFIKWYCKQIGKKKLVKANFEGGPPGQVTIQTQYFFNKDLEYLVSGDNERRNALSISKLKVAYYPDYGLEELVPSLWIESKRDYDISAAYGISHWWFKCKEFYITRHSATFDCNAVRYHMQILSVVSLKTYSRYDYTFLKEIILRRADYKEYKILKADFKNLHPNDFEDMCMLHLQGKLNYLSGANKVHLFNAVNLWIRNIVIRQSVKDLQLGIESYQTKLNLTQSRWDATDFLFKEYYTIVHKPRAMIYKDRNNQKKMMRETEMQSSVMAR